MELARQFLERRRFYLVYDDEHDEPVEQSLFSAAARPQKLRLELRRGEQKASAAKSVAELPQQVAIEFDRGRVTLAAEIVPSAAWGGAGIMSSAGQRARMNLHHELLHGIAIGLEHILTRDVSLEEADKAWHNAEQSIALAAENRHKRHLKIGGALILFIVIVVGLLVWAANG